MDRPRGHCDELSKSERHMPDDFTYMWNPKSTTHDQAEHKQTQIQRTFWWLPDRREVEDGRKR